MCPYRSTELFDANAGEAEVAWLEAATREELRREMGEKPAFIAEAYRRARLHDTKLARMNAMTELEFRAHPNTPLLRDAVVRRHGVALLVDGDAAGEAADAA